MNNDPFEAANKGMIENIIKALEKMDFTQLMTITAMLPVIESIRTDTSKLENDLMNFRKEFSNAIIDENGNLINGDENE